MAAKKEIYINAELDWAEEKLMEWKEYIDANPFSEIKPEIQWKETSKGGMIPMVIASREAQIKCVRDTMKEYLALLKVVDDMRSAEEKAKVARGGSEVPHRMK